jgi:gamma-glutamyltranspeptidase/glutathione hydrolase
MGGNAVDASVAVAFALGVSEPFGSGVGGQVVFLVHPTNGEPFVINGTSRAPDRLPELQSGKQLHGRRSTTVPSSVRTLSFAWRRFGSGRIGWRDLLEPARRCAVEGYAIGSYQHRVLRMHAAVLRQDDALASVFLKADGSVPDEGADWTQPRLGALLTRLGEAGAEDFYKGQIAADIVSDMVQHDGWLSQQDLAEFPEPPVVPALKAKYRGWDVCTLPPPYGGWAVLHALALLGAANPDPPAIGECPTRRIAEVLRRTHALRATAPIRDLNDYDADLESLLSNGAVDESLRIIGTPGSGETTHFSIVDGDGMAISVSASINGYFGARIIHPRWGFLYNDYMREFALARPDHPFAFKPDGIPFSSMSATILAKHGKPHLLLGSPGSKRIVSTVVQVVSRWVDDRKDIFQAVSAPRLHVELPDRLWVENEAIAAEVTALAHHGLAIARRSSPLAGPGGDPYFGGVHAVALERGVWHGAADPRRDGSVVFAVAGP